MNQKELNRFQKGRGIKKVISLPSFVLRMKGKSDATKGLSIAQTQLKSYIDKCSMLENREVLLAEKILHPYRDEAGVLIVKMDKLREKITSIAEPIPVETSMDYRVNKRNENEKATANLELQSSIVRLTQIFELIIDVHACLEQRIFKMRHHCSNKLQAYTVGVTSVDSNFKFEAAYSYKAIENYKLKHTYLDAAIEQAVTSIYNKEVTPDEVI